LNSPSPPLGNSQGKHGVFTLFSLDQEINLSFTSLLHNAGAEKGVGWDFACPFASSFRRLDLSCMFAENMEAYN